MSHIIVSGDDALSMAIIEGLRNAGAHLVRLVNDDVADTPEDLIEAGVSRAVAIVCSGESDVVNLEIALLAKEMNPNIRVVARIENGVLREALSEDARIGAIFDVAELASPSIVDACLVRSDHPFTAAGVEFLVSGREAPRSDTLRAIYGDLDPLAVVSGADSPTAGRIEVCPGRDFTVCAGDWVLLVGTADELSTSSRKPQNQPSPSRIRWRRTRASRLVDSIWALFIDLNPAFYPVFIGLGLLIIVAITLLHANYRASPPMSWIDALYFTAETVTTTGYGDFSFVNQPTWLRVFAVALMFGGVTNTALLVSFVADVLLSRRFSFNRGRPRVRHLRNHIIVVGLSGLGVRVVTDLVDAGYDVVVIEIDQNNRFLPSISARDVPIVFGDATLRETLESANISHARALAVMTHNELVNIETGIVTARILGRPLTPEITRPDVPLVLRVYDRALGRSVAKLFGLINIRSTVELASPWFISAAIGLDVLGTFSVGQESFVVGAMQVVPGSELDGLPMSGLSTKTRVIAISRAGSPVRVRPRHGTKLHADDIVHVIGPYREILETLRLGRFPLQSEVPAP